MKIAHFQFQQYNTFFWFLFRSNNSGASLTVSQHSIEDDFLLASHGGVEGLVHKPPHISNISCSIPGLLKRNSGIIIDCKDPF